MALARTRRDRGVDYWPGFVDALSTLVLGIIFLLSVFVVVQFFLSQEVTGKDTALARLNAQIAQLTELLSMEKAGKANVEDSLAALRASLATAESERERFKGLYEGVGPGAAAAQGKVNTLTSELDSQKQISARALSQVELLNQQIAALRRQLSAIEEALQASEKKDKEAQARIADLGQRLNVALVRDARLDRKSTRLNSSHQIISYAVFCLKKKKLSTLIINNTVSYFLRRCKSSIKT